MVIVIVIVVNLFFSGIDNVVVIVPLSSSGSVFSFSSFVAAVSIMMRTVAIAALSSTEFSASELVGFCVVVVVVIVVVVISLW